MPMGNLGSWRLAVPNYIPHYTKKKQILVRSEEALRRLIRSNATEEKLITAAENVRDARIRVLRAQRATIVPTGDAQERYKKIDARIQRIAQTPTAVILQEFGWMISDKPTEE